MHHYCILDLSFIIRKKEKKKKEKVNKAMSLRLE